MNWRVLGLIGVVIVLGSDPAVAWQATPVELTKDRLPPERMRSLVDGPFAIVAGGDLAGGQTAFEQQLAEVRSRHGNDSLAVADALSAFGVTLFSNGDDKAKHASVVYLHRAIIVMRAAVGPQHPELALALNDYADVVEILNLSPQSGGSIAALREAHAIRHAALGPENPETLSTAIWLAVALSRPQRIDSTPAMRAEAEAIATDLVDRYGRDQRPEILSMLMHGAAKVYAQCGAGQLAGDTLRRLPKDTPDQRLFLAVAASEVAQAFEKIGRQSDADAVRRDFPSLLDVLAPPAGG